MASEIKYCEDENCIRKSTKRRHQITDNCKTACQIKNCIWWSKRHQPRLTCAERCIFTNCINFDENKRGIHKLKDSCFERCTLRDCRNGYYHAKIDSCDKRCENFNCVNRDKQCNAVTSHKISDTCTLRCTLNMCINGKLWHAPNDNCKEGCQIYTCINGNAWHNHLRIDSCGHMCRSNNCIILERHVTSDNCKTRCLIPSCPLAGNIHAIHPPLVYSNRLYKINEVDFKVYPSNCIICMDETNMVFSCGHQICKTCFRGYLKNRCPLCSKFLDTISFNKLDFYDKVFHNLNDLNGLREIIFNLSINNLNV